MDLNSCLQFIIDHWETILTVLSLLFGLIRATKFGKNNQDALIQVMQTIEHFDLKGVKQEVAIAASDVPKGVADAIAHGTAVVDAKKTPQPLWIRILSALFKR